MNVPVIGEVVGGKYRVLATLGRGGMGTVLRAKNTLTGKEVALTWMHSSAGLNSAAAARLLREAEAASRLNHPNVVNVFDVLYEGDTLFLVMELLEGESLRAYLNRNPRPGIADAIELLLPAMQGVAAAHEHGVIHRDLKPDSIFLARGRGQAPLTAKVVDFGVAKVLDSEGLTLTRTGTSLGTPLYMSLEQLRADPDIDQRTDVYAFGVILYEVITGRLPYTANSLTELAIKVATARPTPIQPLRPDVPTRLAALVESAIAKHRERRLPDMIALIGKLESFVRDAALRSQLPPSALVDASATPLRDARSVATPTTLPFATERRTTAARARAPQRISITLLFVAISGAAVWLYWSGRHSADAAPIAVTTSSALTASPPRVEEPPPDLELDLPLGAAPPTELNEQATPSPPSVAEPRVAPMPLKRPRPPAIRSKTRQPEPAAAASGSELVLDENDLGGRL